jgi:hypothetical protein
MRTGKWNGIGAGCLAALLCTVLMAPGIAMALQLEQAVVCENVVDREPMNSGTQFAATIGKLYCFTKLVDADAPTRVTHVWYFGDMERARVDLSVGASTWRTYSSKLIQTTEIGTWRVEILDADENILDTINFEIAQP